MTYAKEYCETVLPNLPGISSLLSVRTSYMADLKAVQAQSPAYWKAPVICQ